MKGMELHKDAVVFDGLIVSNWSRQVFEDMRQGGLTAANCTCSVWEGFHDTMVNIGQWNRWFQEHGDLIVKARTVADIRTAKEQEVPAPDLGSTDLSLLIEEEEFTLIKKILAYPACIEKSALSLEIHRIAFYLQELVSIFHSYYKQHRVVTDNRELTRARLLLLDCLRNVIASGLAVLGVSAPVKM